MLAVSKLASVLLDTIFKLMRRCFQRIIDLHVIHPVQPEMEQAQTAYHEEPANLCNQTYQHQRHVALLDQNSILKTLPTTNALPAPARVELAGQPRQTIASTVWT